MKRTIVLLPSLIAAACLAAMPARREVARLTVELDRPGVPSNRGMWGTSAAV